MEFTSELKAVVFDAVGTLIDPDPPVAEVYARIGQQFGSQLEVGEFDRRFRAAWHEWTLRDATDGWRTSEARERERWRSIVSSVLADADVERCFDELWTHFARPNSWRVRPDVAVAVAAMQGRGLTVGIASNFDARLRTILHGLPALADVDPVLVSSEIGWRKPAAAFFEAVVSELGIAPADILYVGDEPEHDVVAARAAGLQAVEVGQFVANLGNLNS